MKSQNVLLIGRTGSGKSTFCEHLINLVTGSEPTLRLSSNSALSFTNKVWRMKLQDEFDVLDTPGLDDSAGRTQEYLNSLVQVLRYVGRIHAILLFVEVSNRVDATVVENIDIVRCMFGRGALVNVVYTGGDPTRDYKAFIEAFHERVAAKELTLGQHIRCLHAQVSGTRETTMLDWVRQLADANLTRFNEVATNAELLKFLELKDKKKSEDFTALREKYKGDKFVTTSSFRCCGITKANERCKNSTAGGLGAGRCRVRHGEYLPEDILFSEGIIDLILQDTNVIVSDAEIVDFAHDQVDVTKIDDDNIKLVIIRYD
jgi:hypothetical protein